MPKVVYLTPEETATLLTDSIRGKKYSKKNEMDTKDVCKFLLDFILKTKGLPTKYNLPYNPFNEEKGNSFRAHNRVCDEVVAALNDRALASGNIPFLVSIQQILRYALGETEYERFIFEDVKSKPVITALKRMNMQDRKITIDDVNWVLSDCLDFDVAEDVIKRAINDIDADTFFINFSDGQGRYSTITEKLDFLCEQAINDFAMDPKHTLIPENIKDLKYRKELLLKNLPKIEDPEKLAELQGVKDMRAGKYEPSNTEVLEARIKELEAQVESLQTENHTLKQEKKSLKERLMQLSTRVMQIKMFGRSVNDAKQEAESSLQFIERG